MMKGLEVIGRVNKEVDTDASVTHPMTLLTRHERILNDAIGESDWPIVISKETVICLN